MGAGQPLQTVTLPTLYNCRSRMRVLVMHMVVATIAGFAVSVLVMRVVVAAIATLAVGVLVMRVVVAAIAGFAVGVLVMRVVVAAIAALAVTMLLCSCRLGLWLYALHHLLHASKKRYIVSIGLHQKLAAHKVQIGRRYIAPFTNFPFYARRTMGTGEVGHLVLV